MQATPNGFCNYGYVAVKDIISGETKNVLVEDYYKNDCYKSIFKNKVQVIDILILEMV